MKNIAIILVCAIAINATSQTLVKNEIDDFTGDTLMITSWEPLISNLSLTAKFKFKKVNQHYYLIIRSMVAGGKTCFVNEGDKLYILAENKEKLIIGALKHQSSCRGCGATGINGSGVQGIEVYYSLNPNDLNFLLTHNLTKFRMYLNDEYSEGKIKARNDAFIKDSIMLFAKSEVN